MKKAIFLDRDGVINDNKKHVNKPDDLVIYKEAKRGLKKLYDSGYSLFIVTNQGGVELGHITDNDLNKIHKKLIEDLKDFCKIKEIKYCPYFNKDASCRKPNPGMLIELKDKYNIDMSESWMIGDMETDIQAGKEVKCKTAKIGKVSDLADINGDNLEEVADKILELDANKA
ncbi:histidinol-phosphate phosphatase family protein [Gottschalkia purinilytica]|uniref:D,D-heptose 1,7-bisphosphate phosphatase n=1 Tax=Gottschalkia purinilytica TaxID=1503 RepID=A0A0L0W8Z8_GOTPU|nr:HAD-IIIA family hydrolase [Gottschalkia purinilytica]KNF07932.1 histidinol-phosphate phosphatase family protein [Gottschalkia purinilytica]